MIEIIKNKIWDLLKQRAVSLVMIYDREGKIVWYKGRKIKGKSVADGEGFSKTYIKESMEHLADVQSTAPFVVVDEDNLTESVKVYHIKSLLIRRLSENLFLYVDSGSRTAFSEGELEVIKSLGDILGEILGQIRENKRNIMGIAGRSSTIQQIRDRLAEYSLVNEPIILKGETGTGKNHMAELLHMYSGRAGKFKVINTPGIPANLFESELFGHKKGAFTDAAHDKIGMVEEADGGTLFIDEVSEIPMSLQAKLLRFVETRCYTVLGEPGEKVADVRIVAATNRDMASAIKNKEFRADLYYRLNVLEINLPSLKGRKDDLEDLVNEKRDLLRGKKIGKGFWDAMRAHDWPGNVRELITVLKRAGLVAGDTIKGSDIAGIITATSIQPGESEGNMDAFWEALENGGNFWEVVKAPYLDRQLNRSQVKTILERGLQKTGGKYVGLIPLFNLERYEYKNFMRFLYENRLK
ncbi:MAG: sigma-54-dependent Fis family transcriptional regulator [bacterium]|nr:sigma-54-dependent Fis family transcriptional regulator [bacterium]